MAMYYSKRTGGFYDDSIHGTNIPEDAAEISAAQHDALMQAQSQGKVIQADDDGNPVAVERPAYVPTVEDRILALEATITPRRRDEAILGIDDGWLKGVRDQIAGLRSKL